MDEQPNEDAPTGENTEMIAETKATRKELPIEVIEKIGNVVKGAISHISISRIHLSKIIEEILSKNASVHN